MLQMAGVSAVGGAAKALLAGDAANSAAERARQTQLILAKTTPIRSTPTSGTFAKVAAAPQATGQASSLQPVTPMSYRNLQNLTSSPTDLVQQVAAQQAAAQQVAAQQQQQTLAQRGAVA